MELTSHLITGAAFDSISTVEVALTTKLIRFQMTPSFLLPYR